MNKTVSYLLIIILIVGVVGFNILSDKERKTKHESSSEHDHSQKKILDATLIIKNVAIIETDKGTFEIAVLKKDIPQSSKRFLSLAKKDEFKDNGFKKINSWVVQTEELDKDLKFLDCEKANGLDAYRGAVGMAILPKADTITSSFFILKEISPSVAESYTIFGYVIKGMDVVDQLTMEDKIVKTSIRKSNEEDEQTLVKLFNDGRKDRGTFEMFKMKTESAMQAKQMEQMTQQMGR